MGGSVGQFNPLTLVGRFIRPAVVAVAHVLFPRSLRTEADATGTIVELSPLTGAVDRCEVTVRTAAGASVTTFKATVTNETVVIRQTPERRRRVDYRELAAGHEVRVWFPEAGHRPHLRHGAVRQIVIVASKETGG